MLNVHQKIGQILVFCGLAMIAMPVLANDNETNITIDMSDVVTTKDEVAVLQVLSEICPPMLNKKQQQNFVNAYHIELQRLLPVSDPKLAMQYLATQQDYKKILHDTREWTLGFSKNENKMLCVELADSAF